MLRGPAAPPTRWWLVAAALLAALLALPAAMWLFAPRRSVAARPPPAAEPAAAAPHEHPRHRVVLPESPLPPPDPTASTVEAEAGAPVVGVVLDPDGRPVEGADVYCADRDPPITATTDGDGRFHLAPGADGCMAVSRHEGFAPSDLVALSAGRENALSLNREGGIDGEVVDELGAPVQAYVIAIESYRGASDESPTSRSRRIEDPTGAFTWAKLPPGEYVLTAAAQGRPPAHSDAVVVEIGRATHHVRITLPRGATLTGKIVDADTRAPVARAMISLDALTYTGADLTLPARSDDAGAYTLTGAPAGPFSIRVSRTGYRTRVVTGLTTRAGGALQEDVELHAGSDDASPEYAGIGAGLMSTPAGVTVGSLVPSGPAEQAGLQVGDRIARIEGADASDVPLVDCIQRLRGPEGTRVSVQVERGGRFLDVTIQRRLFSY